MEAPRRDRALVRRPARNGTSPHMVPCAARPNASSGRAPSVCAHAAPEAGGGDWRSRMRGTISRFARNEDNKSVRSIHAGSRRMFSSRDMLKMSIYWSGGRHADPRSLRSRHPRSPLPAADRRLRRRAPLRHASAAAARMERAGRARDRASLRARQGRHSAGRVAVLRALRQGDQRAQARAQRRHPGAQLPDARKSTTASPISSAIRSSSRARPPRSMPTSSCNAASTSWPRPRRSSIPTRPC